MIITSKAASRYALALFQVAEENKVIKEVLSDMELISETYLNSKDLAIFLRSPVIKMDIKKKAVREIFAKKLHKITIAFIDIICQKNRISLIGAVATSFVKIYKTFIGVIDVAVESANTLDKKTIQALKKAVELKTGKTAEFTFNVDKELIGGIKITIEDTVVDGSVSNRIANLESLLLNSAG